MFLRYYKPGAIRFISQIVFFGDTIDDDASVGDVVSEIKVEMSDGTAFTGTLTLIDSAGGLFSLHSGVGNTWEIRVANTLTAGVDNIEVRASMANYADLDRTLSITINEAVIPVIPLDDIDFTVYPLDAKITFTASSKRWAYNASNVLTEYAANTPRLKYRDGAPVGTYLEASRTNNVPNPRLTGGTNGTVGGGGALPTNWRLETAGTVTATVSNAGSVAANGWPYFDLRLNGTSAGSNFAKIICFGTGTRTAASNGHVRTIAWPISIVAGGFTVAGHRMNFEHRMYSATPTFLGNIESGALDNASGFVRQTHTANLNQAATTAYEVGLFVRLQNAGAHDVTLRIYSPDAHVGTVTGTPILENITRSAELIILATADTSFDPTSGSAIVDAELDTLTVASDLSLFKADNIFGSERFEIALDTSKALRGKITDGGSLVVNSVGKTVTAIDTQFKIGLAWAANDCAVGANGEDLVLDTVATMPVAPSDIRFEAFNGALARFQLTAERPSNAVFAASTGSNNVGGGSTPVLVDVLDTLVVSSNNQLIENKRIVVTNKDALQCIGKSGVTLRNILIEHTGTGYGMRLQDSPGITLDSVRVLKMDAPASGPLTSERNGIFLNRCTDATLYRVNVEDFSACLYSVDSARLHLSYFDLRNPRGPGANMGSTGIPAGARGQCFQLNRCPDSLIEIGNCIADVNIAWTEDSASIFDSARTIVQDVLFDGNNSPSGWLCLIETSATGVANNCIIRRCTGKNWSNGSFGYYDAVSDSSVVDCISRDSYRPCAQGRGQPTSNSLMLVAGPGTQRISVTGHKRFNLITPTNLMWQPANFIVFDSVLEDVAGLSPIVLANMPGD